MSDKTEEELQRELGRIMRKIQRWEDRREEILNELEPGPAGESA